MTIALQNQERRLVNRADSARRGWRGLRAQPSAWMEKEYRKNHKTGWQVFMERHGFP
jgi:hypothetical protein